jgi:adsorption protein B
VIQKSRWILGISLQGTEHLGWRGDFSFRYMLFRDRKPIVTNLLTLIGLFFVVLFAIDYLVRGDRLYESILAGHWIYQLIIRINVFTMFIFLVTRFVCTTVVYGPVHGVLSVPRIFWGNLINGLASLRAIRVYRSSRKKNTLPRWDKTHHEI